VAIAMRAREEQQPEGEDSSLRILRRGDVPTLPAVSNQLSAIS
jgi:hypothetical protein